MNNIASDGIRYGRSKFHYAFWKLTTDFREPAKTSNHISQP